MPAGKRMRLFFFFVLTETPSSVPQPMPGRREPRETRKSNGRAVKLRCSPLVALSPASRSRFPGQARDQSVAQRVQH